MGVRGGWGIPQGPLNHRPAIQASEPAALQLRHRCRPTALPTPALCFATTRPMVHLPSRIANTRVLHQEPCPSCSRGPQEREASLR